MAQTKRKRKTKHRGNAAGMVEVRGRTSKGGSAGPVTRAGKAPQTAAEKRAARLDQPPTWRGAVNRAAIATVFFLVALLLLFKEDVGPTISIGFFVFALYVPLGYYTDLAIYRRRQKKKGSAR